LIGPIENHVLYLKNFGISLMILEQIQSSFNSSTLVVHDLDVPINYYITSEGVKIFALSFPLT